MQFKNLVILTCLLAANLLNANGLPTGIIPASPSPCEEGGSCDIPPPANFHVIGIGTTWIKYAWNSPWNFQHRIRVYRASDNLLLHTSIVPSGVNAFTCEPLPSATACYAKINVICNDGSNSNQEGTSETVTTLIVDLIVTGFTIPDGVPTCSLMTTGTCLLTSNPGVNTPFKITKISTGDSRQFALKRNIGGQVPFTMSLVQNNGNLPIKLRCHGGTDPNDYCSGPDLIEVWYITEGLEQQIGTLTGSTNLGPLSNFLSFTSMASGYRIDRTDGPGYSPPPGQTSVYSERGGSDSDLKQQAIASPNPFSDALDVYLSESAEKVTLQLFNLSGQKVIDQQFEGKQEQYSLSTAGLSAGFYLLRIEADGDVQTLKVIKSE